MRQWVQIDDLQTRQWVQIRGSICVNGSSEFSLEPLTHVEAHDLDPLIRFEVINLDPLTHLEVCNLDPLTLSQRPVAQDFNFKSFFEA